MKTVHRICAIAALFLMLWMGLSGLAMQASDLWALLTHQRGDSATLLATNEGKFGDGDFPVISKGDYAAQALPADLDTAKAFATTIAALRSQSPGIEPRFVELRMADGRVLGRLGTGPSVRKGPRVEQPAAAFDATTGAPVRAAAFSPIGPPLPTSLRSTGLEFHRFFSHGAGVGVWLMLLAAIVLWVMLVTGLSFYFKLLGARRRLKRDQLFWKAGGWWRTLHRGVSVGASVFLVLIAFSGSWLALESVWHSFRFFPEKDTSAPLTAEQVQRMAGTTLRAFHADRPDTPMKVIRVRRYSGVPQGVVITGGVEVTQLVYQAETSARQSLTEAGYPPSRFPFGDQLHQSMKRFHSGADYGLAARLISLLTGLCLVYLAVSGLVLYFRMWSQRRRAGRPALVWR